MSNNMKKITIKDCTIKGGRVYHDGCVAVLVSYGFGAGWYTWNQESPSMLFNPKMVEAVLHEMPTDKLVDIANALYPDAYAGGVDQLKVEWVKQGSKFRIGEYDGAESIYLEDEEKWFVA